MNKHLKIDPWGRLLKEEKERLSNEKARLLKEKIHRLSKILAKTSLAIVLFSAGYFLLVKFNLADAKLWVSRLFYDTGRSIELIYSNGLSINFSHEYWRYQNSLLLEIIRLFNVEDKQTLSELTKVHHYIAWGIHDLWWIPALLLSFFTKSRRLRIVLGAFMAIALLRAFSAPLRDFPESEAALWVSIVAALLFLIFSLYEFIYLRESVFDLGSWKNILRNFLKACAICVVLYFCFFIAAILCIPLALAASNAGVTRPLVNKWLL